MSEKFKKIFLRSFKFVTNFMSLKICHKFRPKNFLDLKNCFYTKVYRIKFWIQTRIDFFYPNPNPNETAPILRKKILSLL